MSILETFRFSDENKRRTLTLAFLLGFSIILALLYFLWGTFLNFGHLKLTGESPFTVKISKLPEVHCQASPCEIKLHPGPVRIVVTKEGYQNLSTDTVVRRWNTTSLTLALEAIPELLKSTAIPESDTPHEYELVIDEQSGIQKLVYKDDPLYSPLIFFQNPVDQAKIFNSYDKYLLIIGGDGEAYKINLLAKSREKMSDIDFSEIASGSFSPDGRYFLFSDSRSDYLKLLDTQSESDSRIQTILLQSLSTRYDWLYDNSLIFITGQEFIEDVSNNEFVGHYVKPLATQSSTNLLLGKYSPFYNNYIKIDLDLPLSSFPQELITSLSGSEIYLKKGDENFKIILRKF